MHFDTPVCWLNVYTVLIPLHKATDMQTARGLACRQQVQATDPAGGLPKWVLRRSAKVAALQPLRATRLLNPVREQVRSLHGGLRNKEAYVQGAKTPCAFMACRARR